MTDIFLLVCWKEFVNRKMIPRAEVVLKKDEDSHSDIIGFMMKMNAQKRLTTTDYYIFELSAQLEKQGLAITGKLAESESE